MFGHDAGMTGRWHEIRREPYLVAMEIDGPRRVLRLVGVYNAEGSLLGELRYIVGRARGTAHCELCDVTHGRLRKKAEFTRFQASALVPIDLLHSDERPGDIAALTDGCAPCVLAETSSGYRIVLTRDEIARCRGEVRRFDEALTAALRSHDLVL